MRAMHTAVAATALLLPLNAGTAGPGAAAAPPAEAGPSHALACSVASWPLVRQARQVQLVSAELSDLRVSRPAAAAGVGGFVLFGQPGHGQLGGIRRGLAALRAAAASAGQTAPWISTDEEGGEVARLSGLIGPLPAPRTLAATRTPAGIEREVQAHARAMAALGVDVDLAPVLDVAAADDQVADESTRSFSDRPQVVATDGQAFVAGLESGGVTPVAKHFPGLGRASADTDDGPATDPPLSALVGRDLVPFYVAVEDRVPVVMVGHPIVPGLTGGQPASMSPQTYALLHQQLGFRGVAITDALGADAISAAGYTEATAAVRAIASGADGVLVDATDVGAVTGALTAAVRSGALPAATLARAVGALLAAKDASPCGVAPPVGCGATNQARTISAVAADPAVPGGYWAAWADGCVTPAGGAPPLGELHQADLATPVVGIAATPRGRGYWLVTAGGRVVPFGAAAGSGGLDDPATPVAGIAADGTGHGYWLVTAGGRVAAFGGAPQLGPVTVRSGTAPPTVVTGIAGVPGRAGFWALQADGGLSAFGAATSLRGPAPEPHVGTALPEVAVVADRAGPGVWVVSGSGRVSPAGSAPYVGEGSAVPTTDPTVGLVPLRSGYELVLASGEVIRF